MSLKISHERLRAGAAVTLLLCVLLALPQTRALLQRPEWITYDFRMHVWRADRPLHPDLAVVLIDEHSLATMNPMLGRFPWPRSVYADLIEFFRSCGARAVVFDILFSEQQRNAGGKGVSEQDRALVEASRTAGNVYHAAEFRNEIPDENEVQFTTPALPEAARTRFALPQAHGFPDRGLNAYTLPVAGLLEASRGIGGVGIDADADGVFRRTNLFYRYQGAVFPAHGVAPVLDRLPGAITYTPEAIHFGELPVPLDRSGHYLVNMAGRVHPFSIAGVFATILQIREGKLDDLRVNPYDFEGKIVLIGSNAVGLQDLKTTALTTKTPGVYIHASVMSNLLERDFLREAPRWTALLITSLLIAATVFAILATSRILIQVTVPLLLAAAYGAIAVGAFGHGLVLDMALPLTGIALGMLANFTFLVFIEGRDKRRVRAMFSQYVSPAVLEQVVDRFQDQIRAEVGTRQHLSILFSDVRGFTSLSEKLQAEEVVDLLNIHFSVMGEIIFRYQGTLDKFIGDAIMAFWGAPIPVADHARQSVCAAVEMSRHMARVNEQLAAKGYPPIDVGIGINTGDVVLGNIGSEHKLDYTVIGDHVNLGSRLEGLTKEYGCRIIISEYTQRELGGDLPCAVVDMVRVKGKQVPIRIYWPLALPTDAPADVAHAREVADLSEQAFSAYVACRFDEAVALYARLPDCPLRDLFLERCRAYCEAPPPPGWDGVYNLKTK